MGTHIPLRSPIIGRPPSNPTPVKTVRFFGMRNDSEDDDDEHLVFDRSTRPVLPGRKQSFISRWRSRSVSETDIKSTSLERPPIPNALRRSESDSTPLPALSMIVLSITVLGEFLSANVAMPFLLFMVKGALHTPCLLTH
ncbi:hypothetical protein AZE42_03949 [Rhizopogon vesiculosus]|uniref:Uncharacterized protein n=1 Tax=Rhizopogon vesiculosus TaxID=180088 RepID=A0A1J8PUF4_9AGAM|nr:hypothetical protein AZE42_03949 [Rhizopogon vesiculosus]